MGNKRMCPSVREHLATTAVKTTVNRFLDVTACNVTTVQERTAINSIINCLNFLYKLLLPK